jgi:hypothetical protein
MPNDNHLNADVKEGACRNVALTYFLDDSDPDKYSFRTPTHAENAIYRTMKAGCPSAERIVEDCNNCVANLKRVVAADGCYISDNRRAGVRDEGRRESKERNIMIVKSDPTAVKRFEDMFAKVQSGIGLPKELLKRLEQKNVVIEPEQLIDGDQPQEISTDKAAETNDSEEEVVEIEVQEEEDDDGEI